MSEPSEVSADVEYTRLTTHLEYLDEKIFKFLSLYTTIATAIIGGTIFLNAKLKEPTSSTSYVPIQGVEAPLINVLMTLISLGFGWFIIQHLLAWKEYRSTLSEVFPFTGKPKFGWWFSESMQVLFIALIGGGFCLIDPLNTPQNSIWAIVCVSVLVAGLLIYAGFVIGYLVRGKKPKEKTQDRIRRNV